MVKTKEDWESNLKEFEKMLEDNKKHQEQAIKTQEELEFFIEAIRLKLKAL